MLKKWERKMRYFSEAILKEDLEEMCRQPEYQNYGEGAPGNVPLRHPKLSQLIINNRIIQAAYVPWHLERDSAYALTLDFDHDAFSVNNLLHFHLRQIPRSRWIRVWQDLKLDKFWRPAIKNIAPKALRDSIIGLSPPDPQPGRQRSRMRRRGGGGIRFMQVPGFNDFYRPIYSDLGGLIFNVENYKRPAVLFLFCIWTAFLKRTFSMRLAKVVHLLKPTDFMFRETAFAMLTIAQGLSGKKHLSFGYGLPDNLEASQKPTSAPYFGFSPEDQDEDEDEDKDQDKDETDCRHFAAGYGSGYREADGFRGSGEAGTTYWLGSILVQLATDLHDHAVVEAEIDKARLFGLPADQPWHVLDLILLSIQHVVIVRVDGERTLRTETMTLFDVHAPYLKDPTDEPGMRTYHVLSNGSRFGPSHGRASH